MAQVERFVDKTVTQTRGAADDYFNLMQKRHFHSTRWEEQS
jgi:hypothetical protein